MPRQITTNGFGSRLRELPTWWLDQAALPDLFWAAVVIGLDGVRIHLQDGQIVLCDSVEDALHWLSEEEFLPLDDLRADAEVPPDLQPPEDFFSAPA